jgi:hypothetical protein
VPVQQIKMEEFQNNNQAKQHANEKKRRKKIIKIGKQ